jgi:hypothetical protein
LKNPILTEKGYSWREWAAIPDDRFERSRGSIFAEPRRGLMIGMNQFRLWPAQTRVAQPRATVRRISTTPPASTPWTENTFFAKSIPTVDTMLMRLPLLKSLISQANLGTPVPPRDGHGRFTVRWDGDTRRKSVRVADVEACIIPKIAWGTPSWQS